MSKADNKYYVIFVPCFDNDPLTCRGDYKRYVKSVLVDSYDGFDFFFTEDLDQALLCSFKNASYLVSLLRNDSPTASFEEVTGNE